MELKRCYACILLLALALLLAGPAFAAEDREGREGRVHLPRSTGPTIGAEGPESMAEEVNFERCFLSAVDACGMGSIADFDHRGGFLGIGGRCEFTCAS